MRDLMTKPLRSRAEVAEALGVSIQTVGRMIQRRELEAIRIGRQVRIPQESIDAYLAKKGVSQ